MDGDAAGKGGLCNTPATLWSMCLSLPRHHKAFLSLVMLQAVLVVVYRTYLLAAHPVTVDSLWFYMLMIVSAIFVAYFAVHATLFANSFELFAFLVASMFMLLRLIIGFVDKSSECSGNERTSCEVMFGITATFNVVTWFFCYRMQADLRWKKYKAIGADLATIKMYKVYELFVAVRKLDLQFSAIMVLTGFIFFEFSAEERAFLIPNVIIFCIEIAWERFGFMGVRRQNSSYLIAFFVLSTPLPIFVIIVGLLTISSFDLFNEILHSASIVKLAITAAALIINRICTVTIAVILYRNFGSGYRGLRTIFDKENDKWLQLQAITAGGGNADFNKVGGSTDVEMGAAGGGGGAAGKKQSKKKKKGKKKAADTGALADELEAAGSPKANGAGAASASNGVDAGSSSDEDGGSPAAVARPAAVVASGSGSGSGSGSKKKKAKKSKQDKKKKKHKKHKSSGKDKEVVTTVNPITA